MPVQNNMGSLNWDYKSQKEAERTTGELEKSACKESQEAVPLVFSVKDLLLL